MPICATRAEGHEVEHPFEQPVAGAQDRGEDQLLAGDLLRLHMRERRVDLHRLERQVARRLVADQRRRLAQELAEAARRGFLVAHDGELVLHQRVADDRHPFELFCHRPAPPLPEAFIHGAAGKAKPSRRCSEGAHLRHRHAAAVAGDRRLGAERGRREARERQRSAEAAALLVLTRFAIGGADVLSGKIVEFRSVAGTPM